MSSNFKCYTDNCVRNIPIEIVRNRMCPKTTVYSRKYLQFGNLVLDGERVIESSSTSFKLNLSERVSGNGSLDMTCYPQFTENTTISLTITFPLVSLTSYHQQAYLSYIKRSLIGKQRLWAVDSGGMLVWAWAIMSSYSDIKTDNVNSFVISIEFNLPEGVWHIADLSKVHILPYDRCEFQRKPECCVQKCLDVNIPCKNEKPCSGCQSILKCLDDSTLFCYSNVNLYYECRSEFKIEYVCRSNDRNIFKNFGMGIPQNHINMITATFCSYTILKGSVKVTLVGSFINPEIIINNQSMTIEGTYKGILVIDEKADVYYYPDAQRGTIYTKEKIPYDSIIYCNSMTNFDIISCENHLSVLGANNNMAQYVFLDIDEVTY